MLAKTHKLSRRPDYGRNTYFWGSGVFKTPFTPYGMNLEIWWNVCLTIFFADLVYCTSHSTLLPKTSIDVWRNDPECLTHSFISLRAEIW